MQKFFRKYNKLIMTVVAVLMMIVFIGGTALDALLQPNRGDIAIGNAFGAVITQSDQDRINKYTTILGRLGMPWSTPWGFDFRLEPLSPLDYLLLTQEAQDNGMNMDINRSREFLKRRAPQQLTRFRLNLRVSEEEVENAIANMLLVQDAWLTAQSSVSVSNLDLNRAVKRMHEKLNATVVALSTSAFVDAASSFDEATLQAHFDKYKEQLSDNSALGFGYMMPDQVQVEYIKIATADITPRRQITRKMAENHWQEHKTDFPRPVDDTETAEEEDADGEADSPYFENFDEVQEQVYAALRRQQQLEIGRQMAEILRQRLADQWFGQDIAEDGYPELPEGVDGADYYRGAIASLAAGLEAPQAITVAQTGFFAGADAAEQAEIGGSRQDIVGRASGPGFGIGIERVQGLEERSPDDPAQIGGPLARYQTAPRVMIDGDDNLYLYRIVAVQLAQPPASLDSVRDRVIEDLRLQQAFDRAVEHAHALRNSVGQEDLLAAWDSYDAMPDELKAEGGGAFEAAPFARTTGTASPVVVRDKAAREENTIFSEQFVSSVYDLRDAEGSEAVGVIEVPELQKAFVVQLAGIEHLTPDQFEQNRDRIRFRLVQDRLERLKREWFDSDKIRARCNWTLPSTS